MERENSRNSRDSISDQGRSNSSTSSMTGNFRKIVAQSLKDRRKNNRKSSSGDGPIAMRKLCSTYHSEEAEVFQGHIRINVGGTRYVFQKALLAKKTGTRLCDLVLATAGDEATTQIEVDQIADEYWESTSEYYFDRPASIFEWIATYYRTGFLHKPEMICTILFRQELRYWRIETAFIMNCCDAARLIAHLSQTCRNSLANNKFTENVDSMSVGDQHPEKGRYSYLAEKRKYLWRVLEYPLSSKYALVYACLSVLIILMSAGLMIVETVPNIRCEPCESNGTDWSWGLNGGNGSFAEDCSHHELWQKEPAPELACYDVHLQKAVYVTKMLVLVWFTFDYVARLCTTPKILGFIISPLGIVDLMTILPFYIEVMLRPTTFFKFNAIHQHHGTHVGKFSSIFQILRFFRLMRIVIIFKLARLSTGMRLMAMVLRYSISALSLILIYAAIYVVIFATILHYLEGEEKETQFTSIPAACWWAVVTLTTLGYGDMVPQTGAGRAVGAIATIISILILAFPVSIIVDNMKKAFSQINSAKTAPQKITKKRGLFHGWNRFKGAKVHHIPELQFAVGQKSRIDKRMKRAYSVDDADEVMKENVKNLEKLKDSIALTTISELAAAEIHSELENDPDAFDRTTETVRKISATLRRQAAVLANTDSEEPPAVEYDDSSNCKNPAAGYKVRRKSFFAKKPSISIGNYKAAWPTESSSQSSRSESVKHKNSAENSVSKLVNKAFSTGNPEQHGKFSVEEVPESELPKCFAEVTQ